MSDASLNVKLKLDLSDVESQLKSFSGYAKKAISGNVGGGATKSPLEKDLDLLKQVMKSEENLARQRAKNDASAAARQRRTIIGLADPNYGKQLAKIHAMGSIEDQLQAESDKKKAIAQREADRQQRQWERDSLAGSRTNIRARTNAEREQQRLQQQQEKDAMAASRTNIRVRLNAERERQRQQRQQERDAMAASRLNIAMRNRAERQRQQQQGIPVTVAFAGMLRSLVMYRAITESFGALKAQVDNVTNAFSNAQRAYAKALTSGLGMATTQKRSIQAGILGVSEDEVLRFGAALNWINPQIEKSVAVLQKTAMPLAEMKMKLSILGVKFEAFGAKLAESLMPILDDLADSLGAMLESAAVAETAKAVLWAFAKVLQLIQFNVQSIAGGFLLMADGIRVLMAAVNDFIHFLGKVNPAIKLLTKVTGVGSELMTPEATANFAKNAKETANMQMKLFGNIFGMDPTGEKKQKSEKLGGKEGLPAPQSFMKQIPASSWEKMGLVIGGRGNTTNDLIRTSNQHLKTIADHVSGRGGVPRAFGLNPNVANP